MNESTSPIHREDLLNILLGFWLAGAIDESDLYIIAQSMGVGDKFRRATCQLPRVSSERPRPPLLPEATP